MQYLKKNKKNLLIILLLFLFSLPALFSLFHSGFFQSDDGEWMIIRFSAFHQALRDGQFPVRFLTRLNYGYGYPVSNFLYPGFMYLSEPIKFLGFSFVDTVKIILGLSIFGSGIFTYLWLLKFFNKTSSFIGALFFIYTPYHLFDLYKRGSAGEILALAIIPFILLQLERKSIFWSSLGLAFLIISHNTLALLFIPIIILYGLLDVMIAKERKVFIYRYASMLLCGLGISAFFWIPAFFEIKYTNFSNISVSNFSEYFANVNLIGLSTIFVFILVSVSFLLKKAKLSKHRLTLLLFIIGILSIFFSTSISFSLWKILPVSFIQFPFRILSSLVLSVAFLSAFIISNFKNRKKYLVSCLFVVLLFLSACSYLFPNEFFNKGDNFYSTNEGTTTVKDEYLPKWVKNKPNSHFKEKVEIVQGKAELSNLVFNSNKTIFNIFSDTNSKVKINTIYYPGWEAFIDGKESNIEYNNDHGLIELTVPKGSHLIKVSFSETPFRLFADVMTIFSLLGLIVFIRRLRISK